MTTTTGAHVHVTVTMPHVECPGRIAALLEQIDRERRG